MANNLSKDDIEKGDVLFHKATGERMVVLKTEEDEQIKVRKADGNTDYFNAYELQEKDPGAKTAGTF